MNSVYYLKIWAVPLKEAVLTTEFVAGSYPEAATSAMIRLEEYVQADGLWVELLDDDFYMYGVGEVWTGVFSLKVIGYAPG